MMRFQDVRQIDSASLLLLAAAFASLSVAIMLSVRPVAAAIPDCLLDRVRGADPNTVKQPQGTCTAINVQTANSPPPGPTPPYVDGSVGGAGGCAIAGQPCIVCNTGAFAKSFLPAPGNGTLDVFHGQAIDCNPTTGEGTLGSCTLFGGNLMCNATGDYDCSTTASNYPTQPQPPG